VRSGAATSSYLGKTPMSGPSSLRRPDPHARSFLPVIEAMAIGLPIAVWSGYILLAFLAILAIAHLAF
jgi:hypothetical protein